jgi:phosphatidate cytidylyltransferase
MTNQTKWRVVGFFYVSIPIYAIIRLRFIDSDIVFWMFLIIWTTDITAYFTGKILGGKKLAPKISPGKTWSGFYGGFLGAILVGLLSSLIFVGSVYFFLVLSIFISIISQLSDLLESKFKRIFGVKDSGNLIPGHGGVLDRLDGMILSAPFLLFIFNLFPHKFGF